MASNKLLFNVGDEVLVIKGMAEHYNKSTEGRVGEVVEADKLEGVMPYRVRFPGYGTAVGWWFYEDQLRRVED
jgi:hypothetical protein